MSASIGTCRSAQCNHIDCPHYFCDRRLPASVFVCYHRAYRYGLEHGLAEPGWHMARITQRLTAIEVTNLKDKGLYPDGDGLYLKVTGTGTKSWIYRFTQGGFTRDMGLGPASAVL